MTPASAMAPGGMLRSPLLQAGGYGLCEGVVDARTFAALQAEALARYGEATEQVALQDDGADGRGGIPARRLVSSGGGPTQDALYHSPALQRVLSAHCGVAVVPSGGRGSYSYYTRPGDFLDLHLDIDVCDVTMITVLHDATGLDEPGGALALYPTRMGEPLSAIRSRPDDGVRFVKARMGQTFLLFGGLVPHRVLPVVEGQQRIISVLCFRADGTPG